jgi:hypothetical protein
MRSGGASRAVSIRIAVGLPCDHVYSLRARHAPVDDGDVVVVELQEVDGVVAALSGVNLVATVVEAENQDLTQTWVVLRNEHAHRRSFVYPAPAQSYRVLPPPA